MTEHLEHSANAESPKTIEKLTQDLNELMTNANVGSARLLALNGHAQVEIAKQQIVEATTEEDRLDAKGNLNQAKLGLAHDEVWVLGCYPISQEIGKLTRQVHAIGQQNEWTGELFRLRKQILDKKAGSNVLDGLKKEQGVLQLRGAQFGINVSPEVLIRLQDIEKELKYEEERQAKKKQ